MKNNLNKGIKMSKRIILLFLFLILILKPLTAEYSDNYSDLFNEKNEEKEEEKEEDDDDDNDDEQIFSPGMYKNNPHKQTPGLSVFKPNYMIVTHHNLFDRVSYYSERKDYEVQMQFSFKQQIFQIKNIGIYGVYSQKSFFQLFDFENSSPFRETNYNPQAFVKWSFLDRFAIDFGFDHESNGQRLPESRSWNRIYIYPHFKSKYFAINWRFWYRIPEEKKPDPLASAGDDNPDIIDYYGNHELNIVFEIWRVQMSTIGRFNSRTKKGAIQVELTLPLIFNTTCLYFQYWNGYGESLIDYNVKLQRFGLGLMFSR